MLTFCINSTRGRGGHESPRWIRALGIHSVTVLRDEKEKDVTALRYLIAVGGLYAVTALRKAGAKVTVYARHLELKQASKQASKHASMQACMHACMHASAIIKTRVASRCAWRRRPVPRPLSGPRLRPPAPVPSRRRILDTFESNEPVSGVLRPFLSATLHPSKSGLKVARKESQSRGASDVSLSLDGRPSQGRVSPRVIQRRW